MERYRSNSLDTPIGRRDITGGHGASRDDQRRGYTAVDAESDAIAAYEWDEDDSTITIIPPKGLLRRSPGNADEDEGQRNNNDPLR